MATSNPITKKEFQFESFEGAEQFSSLIGTWIEFDAFSTEKSVKQAKKNWEFMRYIGSGRNIRYNGVPSKMYNSEKIKHFFEIIKKEE
jgi:hypothetical protein